MKSVVVRLFNTVVMKWPPPKYYEKKPKISTIISLSILHIIVGLAIYYAVTQGGFMIASYVMIGFIFLLAAPGIGLGYHRFFTHLSFEAKPWFAHILAACGALANEGKTKWWCALHHAHHKYYDRQGDPHSPNDGFLWAHMLCYMFKYEDPHFWDRVKYLEKNPAIRWQEKYYYIVAYSSFFVPPLIGFVIGGVPGAIDMFLASSLTVFAVLHYTWGINSWAHLGMLPPKVRWIEKIPLLNLFIGRQDRRTIPEDRSRNVPLLATITFGKGNHNYHHAQPRAAYFASNNDINKWIILTMGRLGVIWNIRSPNQTH